MGNRGKRVFISGEQGNKCQILRGTGEQRQHWGTGNIRKQIFDFLGTGEQANLFQGNKGTGTPLGGPHYLSYFKFDAAYILSFILIKPAKLFSFSTQILRYILGNACIAKTYISYYLKDVHIVNI